MKKKIWTEEKITGEILKVVELLNLERMPSLAEYQINASGGYDALIRYGGMKHFSKMVNLPVERKIRQKEDSCIPVSVREAIHIDGNNNNLLFGKMQSRETERDGTAAQLKNRKNNPPKQGI